MNELRELPVIETADKPSELAGGNRNALRWALLGLGVATVGGGAWAARNRWGRTEQPGASLVDSFPVNDDDTMVQWSQMPAPHELAE